MGLACVYPKLRAQAEQSIRGVEASLFRFSSGYFSVALGLKNLVRWSLGRFVKGGTSWLKRRLLTRILRLEDRGYLALLTIRSGVHRLSTRNRPDV